MRATISILTYSAITQVRKCLASVLAFSIDYDLILTANGSPEAAKVFQAHALGRPNVRVVVNEENLGFMEPNRRALAMTETPLFVMLNDDTIVCRDWLDKLRAPFILYPKAALSGPRSRFCRLAPDMVGVRGHPPEYLEGSCLMCRTDLMKEHGLFSPELQFAYGEDSDLSLRMRQLGYTIHQTPFEVYHEGNATSRHVSAAFHHFHANHTFLRAKWAPYLQTQDRKFPAER